MRFTVYWFDIEENKEGDPIAINANDFMDAKDKAMHYLGSGVKCFSEKDLRYMKDENGELYRFDEKQKKNASV